MAVTAGLCKPVLISIKLTAGQILAPAQEAGYRIRCAAREVAQVPASFPRRLAARERRALRRAKAGRLAEM